jgi:hypothetical protein
MSEKIQNYSSTGEHKGGGTAHGSEKIGGSPRSFSVGHFVCKLGWRKQQTAGQPPQSKMGKE